MAAKFKGKEVADWYNYDVVCYEIQKTEYSLHSNCSDCPTKDANPEVKHEYEVHCPEYFRSHFSQILRFCEQIKNGSLIVPNKRSI